MKYLYPTWYGLFNKDAAVANASVALQQFRTIFALPNAPKNEQSTLVQRLIGYYDAHVSRMTDFKQMNDPSSAAAEKQSWEDSLAAVSKKDTRLTSVINSVFSKLG